MPRPSFSLPKLDSLTNTTLKPKVMAAAATAIPAGLLALWLAWPQSGPLAPPAVELEQDLAGLPPAPISASAVAALEAESEAATLRRRVQVEPGDTLMSLLVDAGAPRGQAHAAITALAAAYSPRALKPGQAIDVVFAPEPETPSLTQRSASLQLEGLNLRPNVERDIRVIRQAPEGGFTAEVIERPLNRQLSARSGQIDSSLFLAGRAADVPLEVMIELIRIYSFDVDFQREIQPGDRFEMLYESYLDLAGRRAKTGNVVYAALILSGERLELFRYTPKSGNPDYFDGKGQSVRKTLMRTPIDGARISSSFGMRKHPIQGYNKMHRGVDFAAPRGTPIYAAGDGVVEAAGRNGGYGKYVRIRHNGSYKTAYAHLKGYGKGIRKGKRVRQGQIIGYVGSTGNSTGPHLHYEILKNNKHVNPIKIKLPSGEKLKGSDLAGFQESREILAQQYALAAGAQRLACGGAVQGSGAETGSASDC